MKNKKTTIKSVCKKKKGFTLLEIIAAIIIIGIISVISISAIRGVIKSAEKGAFKKTVENLSREIANNCQVQAMEDETITTYYVIKDGTLSPSIQIKGKLPDSGVISVDKKTCRVGFKNIKRNNLIARKALDSNDIIINEGYPNTSIKDGDVVYLDSTDLTRYCDEDNSSDSTGTKIGCMKWYAFNVSEENETLNLLLGHNTTTSVKWNSDLANLKNGPKEVVEKLKSDTDNWVTPFIENNYIAKFDTFNVDYEIKYNTDKYKFKARLITAEEIAHIVGADRTDTLNWKISNLINEYTSHFYFDGSGTAASGWFNQVANATNKSKYSWLFNNTYDCIRYGCDVEDNTKYLYDGVNTYNMYGYWTASVTCANSLQNVWMVNDAGTLDTRIANGYKSIGIRPVIEVLKYDL